MRYVVPSLFDDFDSMFNDFFGSVGSNRKFPPVDITENDESYELEFEVPGYKEDGFRITTHKGILTVASDGVESSEEDYLIKEISRPAYSRSFQLPEDADENEISAENRNGILTVKIMKAKKALPKRIDVKIC